MTFQEIAELVAGHFSDSKIDTDTKGPQSILIVPKEDILSICEFLFRDNRLFFDHLACITAIDNGPVTATMEIIYNFTSIPYGHDLILKAVFPRNAKGEPLPVVSSVAGIWRTADWHEREAYDLMGLHFEGHPDLRRILLPEDWEGHPLRKDYSVQHRYHGIYVRYADGVSEQDPTIEDRA
jgi:NADH-quinone oxidoreductase subunit C